MSWEYQTVPAQDFVRSFLDEVWNSGNVDLISERLSGDPEEEEHTKFVNLVRTAFPDARLEIEDVVGTEQMGTVVALLKFSGTHQGTIMQVSPTGKQVSLRGAFIAHLFVSRGGKWLLTDVRVLWDHLELVRQLGLFE